LGRLGFHPPPLGLRPGGHGCALGGQGLPFRTLGLYTACFCLGLGCSARHGFSLGGLLGSQRGDGLASRKAGLALGLPALANRQNRHPQRHQKYDRQTRGQRAQPPAAPGLLLRATALLFGQRLGLFQRALALGFSFNPQGFFPGRLGGLARLQELLDQRPQALPVGGQGLL